MHVVVYEMFRNYYYYASLVHKKVLCGLSILLLFSVSEKWQFHGWNWRKPKTADNSIKHTAEYFHILFFANLLGDIHVPNTQRVKKALELKLLHDLTPFQVFTNFTVKSDVSIIERASAAIKAAS